jgi:transcriptional regulator with XRE-family HTH domain
VINTAAETIRYARLRARLTQTQLAERMGTTQSAIARLEARGSNPRVETLERVLEATGHRLVLAAARAEHGIDNTLIAERLRMTPAQRLSAFQAASHDLYELELAGARARGRDSA